MILHLGNANPLHVADSSESGERTTFVDIPDGTSLMEAMSTVTGVDGVWANQSSDPAPTWVASDDPALESALAAHYGVPVLQVPGLNSGA